MTNEYPYPELDPDEATQRHCDDVDSARICQPQNDDEDEESDCYEEQN